MTIDREIMATEFVSVAKNYYPKTALVIRCCYVKILECYIERLKKRLYYIGIYYPEGRGADIQENKEVFKEIAENLGLLEVVYINATRLVRDPLSQLKRDNPRLWLELYWVASQN